jgi:hypothetical protein
MPLSFAARPQAYDVRVKEGAAQLLAALAPLTNLKRLNLTDILLEPLTLPPDGLQSTTILPFERSVTLHRLNPFSALTASSVLESLTLAYRSTEEGGDPLQPLPMGAVAAMFPPGRQLTALTGKQQSCGNGAVVTVGTAREFRMRAGWQRSRGTWVWQQGYEALEGKAWLLMHGPNHRREATRPRGIGEDITALSNVVHHYI